MTCNNSTNDIPQEQRSVHPFALFLNFSATGAKNYFGHSRDFHNYHFTG